MPNFIDYISWRGDVPLTASPFNAVDNLILAELAYADLRGIAPDGGSITLAEAWRGYEAAGKDQSSMVNDPKPLLKAAAGSARFGGIPITGYVDELDPAQALQFAAMRFHLPDGTVYVGYRGTDSTFAGWREDFNLSYLPEVPAQRRAAAYLDETAALSPAPLRVGGHSKGGNLAVYAAAFCGDAAFGRLLTAYSNDGPGFNQAVMDAPGYARAMGKALQIIPEASLVGVLLGSQAARVVVKSSALGVLQHDPYSWEVLGPDFVPAERDGMSLFLDDTLSQWLRGLDDSQRASLTDALFDTLEASGAASFDEMNANRRGSLSAMMKAVAAMDPALQKQVMGMLRQLADAGWDVFWADARKNLKGLMDTLPGRKPRET